MMIPTTHGSAERRAVVVACGPLFEILSESLERKVRFRLSYRSGISGGIMDYDKTGALPVGEALALCEMTSEREENDYKALKNCVRMGMWGKDD
ncbi:MAG: hypothetical protein PHX83_06880 [Acidobacteriia bacterium]|nr:hypothetical protein [Terriglobia bacterium]